MAFIFSENASHAREFCEISLNKIAEKQTIFPAREITKYFHGEICFTILWIFSDRFDLD